MSPTPLVAFDEVSKWYPVGLLRRESLAAVTDVTFRIEPGQVFGLLGPNRAGKTTLVKLLLSLCRPTAGRVLRLGLPAGDRQTLSRVGYMHECQAFPRYLTAAGLLHYYGALTLIPEALLDRRVPEWLERVGLTDRCREPIGRFSKGMIQRLGLAQAMLNDPDLLVLDEPTEGLDLAGRRLVREVLAEQRRRGRTALLVSHVLTEVENLCDNLAVLAEGKLVYSGSLSALTQDRATGTSRPLEHALRELYDSGPRLCEPCLVDTAQAIDAHNSREVA
jgi:ABC-2 type transport system ATP-binding protein